MITNVVSLTEIVIVWFIVCALLFALLSRGSK